MPVPPPAPSGAPVLVAPARRFATDHGLCLPASLVTIPPPEAIRAAGATATTKAAAPLTRRPWTSGVPVPLGNATTTSRSWDASGRGSRRLGGRPDHAQDDSLNSRQTRVRTLRSRSTQTPRRCHPPPLAANPHPRHADPRTRPLPPYREQEPGHARGPGVVSGTRERRSRRTPEGLVALLCAGLPDAHRLVLTERAEVELAFVGEVGGVGAGGRSGAAGGRRWSRAEAPQ